MTMGELADRLQASSGAISGAIKMLTSVGLVERVPAPASRRDHYRLRDNAWAVLLHKPERGASRPCSRPAEAGIADDRAQQPGRATPHPDARLLQLLAGGDPGAA